MYHIGTGNTISMTLNSSTSTIINAKWWNNTTPTSSLIYLGNGTEVNGNTDTFIGYAFAEKTGFSKFMGWSGNGETDGTFLYTGFKPAFFMYKVATGTTGGWGMLDNKRDTINPVDNTLSADSNTSLTL